MAISKAYKIYSLLGLQPCLKLWQYFKIIYLPFTLENLLFNFFVIYHLGRSDILSTVKIEILKISFILWHYFFADPQLCMENISSLFINARLTHYKSNFSQSYSHPNNFMPIIIQISL